jgi:hypothetical protein
MNMDAATLRANEQLKAASAVIANLGTALVAAAFARWFAFGVDPLAPVWLVVGGMIMWGGIPMLNDLQTEPVNG